MPDLPVIWTVLLDQRTLKPSNEPSRSNRDGDPAAIARLAEGFCPLPDCHPGRAEEPLLVTPDGWAYCPHRFNGDGYDAWRFGDLRAAQEGHDG